MVCTEVSAQGWQVVLVAAAVEGVDVVVEVEEAVVVDAEGVVVVDVEAVEVTRPSFTQQPGFVE